MFRTSRRRRKPPLSKRVGRRVRRILVWTLALAILLPVGAVVLYRFVPPPMTPLMVIRLFEGEGVKKDWVPLARISPHVANSVIALEDNRFCEHSGFDWRQVAEAVADYSEGERLRGASTISMQTAKNLFLWPGRDFLRKGLEVPLTVLLEVLWDKQRIMEVYLNVVEWGPGIYGAEAAARHYFGKPAQRLTRREAALMAAVLPNPRRWSPAAPTSFLDRRARASYTRVAQLGPLLNCGRAAPRSV